MTTRVFPSPTVRFLCVALALTLAACAPTTEEAAEVALPDGAEEAAAVITAEILRAPIAELSDDSYEGRGPGTAGDEKARQYMIGQLEAIGFEPAAADGSWEQYFDIVGVDATAPAVWSFDTGEGNIDLAWHDDYIASSGVQEETASIDGAELVFVGFGIEAPEYGWDDYKGQDLTGKVLVMMNNDPDWDADLFAGDTRLYYGRWTYKYEKAAELGAAGAIIIHTDKSAGYGWNVVQTSWTGPQDEIPAAGESRIQIAAWATEDASRRLFSAAGHDLDQLRESAKSPDFAPVALGITTSLELSVELQKKQTANVVAVLPGTDLADEYVVYSAHHDHLGVSPDESLEDRIYNGALDNASGVSQLLAIGRAFVALPERPRRSILIALVAAEEQGLLGSAYFAQNPPMPAGKMAANINFDGGNIWGKNKDVTYIGYGKSSLDAVVERFAGEQGRTVKPDQFADKGYFYRSDQFNFAKVGVPAIYLDTGTEFVDRPEGWGKEQMDKWIEVHYHQPSDELVDDWNFDGMIDDAVLGFRCGLYLATQDEMASWNEGDEFEAARLEALAAVDG